MTLGPDVRTSDTESPAGRELATASLTCALAAEADNANAHDLQLYANRHSPTRPIRTPIDPWGNVYTEIVLVLVIAPFHRL